MKDRSGMSEEIQRAQICARLVEATASERGDQLTLRANSIGRDPCVAPCEIIVCESERLSHFVVEHGRGLHCIPVVFGRENTGAEHVEKAMHFSLHALMKKAHRMMQSGGKLNRHTVRSGGYERARDLHRSRERWRHHTAGAQLETETGGRRDAAVFGQG